MRICISPDRSLLGFLRTCITPAKRAVSGTLGVCVADTDLPLDAVVSQSQEELESRNHVALGEREVPNR
jgi:hypothetical protein